MAGSVIYQNLRYCLHNHREGNICQGKWFLCCRTYTLFICCFVSFKRHYETAPLKADTMVDRLLWCSCVSTWYCELNESLRTFNFVFYSLMTIFLGVFYLWKKDSEIENYFEKSQFQRYSQQLLLAFSWDVFLYRWGSLIQIKPQLCILFFLLDKPSEFAPRVPTWNSYWEIESCLGFRPKENKDTWENELSWGFIIGILK